MENTFFIELSTQNFQNCFAKKRIISDSKMHFRDFRSFPVLNLYILISAVKGKPITTVA